MTAASRAFRRQMMRRWQRIGMINVVIIARRRAIGKGVGQIRDRCS
jgi:hypothetical protein